jgi:hypothetical protein
MMAVARHLHARYAEGLRLAERVLAVPPPPRVTYGTQRVDGRVMMHTLVAKTHWLIGRPETALREMRMGVNVALEMRHAGTLCYALSLGACPVALWAGETEDARRYIALLIETASRWSLRFWLTWGHAFARTLDLAVGHGLRAADLGSGASLCDHLVTVRGDLLDDATDARLLSGAVGWAGPEIARTKALRIAADGDARGAEGRLLAALDMAKEQGALGWELRVSTTLAALRRDRGDVQGAHEVVRAALSKFTEGANTADNRAAMALLASLEASAG